MLKLIIFYGFIAITTSILFLVSSSPTNNNTYSFYHSYFLSDTQTSNESISKHLYILTRRPHVAGTEANAQAAAYVLSTLNSYHIQSRITTYDVALTYPISRSLTLTSPKLDSPIKFDLIQEIYNGDPYADVAKEVMPTFHAYAKSGTASGLVVYANYGRLDDFAKLKEMNVNVTGTVVLARYGEAYRGNIVANAYAEGALGVLIFSDRKDYGGGGGDAKWFPDDKWLPPSGVQVGSVFNGAGDPTTPGWASNGVDCERLSEDEVEKAGDVPLIPSLPISWFDGYTILRTIGGHVGPDDWQGGKGKDVPVYRVGPGPSTAELSYLGKQVISTIQNVIGVIEGAEEPDRYIPIHPVKYIAMLVFGDLVAPHQTSILYYNTNDFLMVYRCGASGAIKDALVFEWELNIQFYAKFVILGNHRDAWTFGAVDPNSGTASLLEVAHRMMKLHSKGWRPRRTLIFCNWDAEEYGLVGSTEWVEENQELLKSRVVAYLNVDVAVSGAGFHASATPQLDELLKVAAMLVVDPDNSSQSLYQSWSSSGEPQIGRLGAGSDYTAFLQHVGIPATDMIFGAGYPVYHSMYDDFIWMSKFGDPMFQRHTAASSIWGLVALRLADQEILPFNYMSYANELQTKAEELQVELKDSGGLTVYPLFRSIDEFKKAASKISEDIKVLQDRKGWVSAQRNEPRKVRDVNDRLMMTERAFIDGEGLPGRPWFKHLIYAPSKHDRYSSKYFPGVYDSIEEAKVVMSEESWRLVQHEIWRVARAIKHASLVLHGELT